jgi:acetyl-CoA carboxylase biotin carboxyl carrier protein
MNLEGIKDILALVREHELAEFELELDGLKIRVRKDTPVHIMSAPAAAAPAATPVAAAHGPVASLDRDTVPLAEDEALELAVVKSPMVGTFYRAPEPGARPFVEVGMQVSKGQVLCIIEAMKLMNEIESEYDGEVVRVYVENGQPVQFGERLFAIKAR